MSRFQRFAALVLAALLFSSAFAQDPATPRIAPSVAELRAQLDKVPKIVDSDDDTKGLVSALNNISAVSEKLIAARMAADVCGTPTLVIARTDAEAADLITSDYDENDKPFITGERTAEGFYRTKKGMDQAISRAIAYAHYADLVWCETGTPDLDFAKKFADAVQIGRAHV